MSSVDSISQINSAENTNALNEKKSFQETEVKILSDGNEDKVEISTKNMSVQDMLDKGLIEKKGGCYVYTATGLETCRAIKKKLNIADGGLRKANYNLFKDVKGSYDNVVPPKGTDVKIYGEDLPSSPVAFKSDEGEDLTGFYETADGELFYKVQSADTQTSIYEKLSNSAFDDYKTADILKGYPDYQLSVGTRIVLHEKGFLGKLFG